MTVSSKFKAFSSVLPDIVFMPKGDDEEFSEEFDKCMKLGIHEGCTNRTEVAEWSGEERIYLKEHVERVKQGQDDISYIPGESIALVSTKGRSNHGDAGKKRKLEKQKVDFPVEQNWSG